MADLTRANTLRAERDAIADPAARTAYLQRKVDDKVLTPEVKEQLDALDAYPVVSKYPQAQKVQFFNSLTPKQQALFNQIAEQQAKR